VKNNEWIYVCEYTRAIDSIVNEICMKLSINNFIEHLEVKFTGTWYEFVLRLVYFMPRDDAKKILLSIECDDDKINAFLIHIS
jgi:hypothetical protein